MARTFRALDLFAGCGGLSYGLALAGINVVAANEFWSDAAATHRLNHKGTAMIEGDVTSADIKTQIIKAAGEIDLLAGGPPCQAYSLSGRRDPLDPRGKLFNDYVELVAAIKPRFVLMENVKGLLTMKHDRIDLSASQLKQQSRIYKEIESLPSKYTRGHTDTASLAEGRQLRSKLMRQLQEFQEPVLRSIVKDLEGLGYTCTWKVLNSADYGVPQRRERVILLGARQGEPLPPYPEATHQAGLQEGLFPINLLPWVTTSDAINDLATAPENASTHHIYTAHSAEFLEKIRATPLGASVFTGYQDAYYRNPPDVPARTVKENHNGVFVHYREHRVMTPRELARLQSFPDSFIFHGTKSSVLKQIGNAVPPLLGKAIGEALLSI